MAAVDVALTAPIVMAAPATVDAASMPPLIQAMLDAAIASGNENDVAAVVRYAIKASPENATTITKLASDWTTKRRAAAREKIRKATLLELVKVHAELGGYTTEGNTNGTGVTAVLDLKREGITWRHKLRLQADFIRSAGVTSREHYLASYEPNYRFSPRGYVYGAAQYESDRFLGYYNRYSSSVGAGYSAVKKPRVTLDLELGPAFRQTRFTDSNDQSNLAVRGSMDFGLKLTRDIDFHQNASAYVESYNSTVSAKSTLRAKLIGPLSAQLSYTLQYESRRPTGGKTTDTASRASFVMDF